MGNYIEAIADFDAVINNPDVNQKVFDGQKKEKKNF